MRLALPCLCLALILKADRPELSARDIMSAADHSSGRVAPGEIVVLYSTNAGPDALAGSERTSEGKIATLLAETRVWFDDIAAPVVYSVKGQVSAVVPYEISRKNTTQVVVEYQGVRSLPVTIPVVETIPALFTLDATGQGQAAMLNDTGCCNSSRNPAARGTFAALYATGAGQTNPPGITGNVSAYLHVTDYPKPQRAVRVTVGGEPAEIIFAAEAPHTVTGLLQVNFRIPANAPIGDAVPIVLTVGDHRSPDGVTMAIRSAVQRVLVIDNEWLARVLAQAGYEVLTHPTEQPIDLVITSLKNPETVAALRATRPKLKIIATAASLSPETLRAADLLGAQAIFTRPITSKAVLQRVRDLLRPRPVPYVALEIPPLPRR
jgi:uncharacterized protein (TIGR03437 family)